MLFSYIFARLLWKKTAFVCDRTLFIGNGVQNLSLETTDTDVQVQSMVSVPAQSMQHQYA